jgi:hypothetical protein
MYKSPVKKIVDHIGPKTVLFMPFLNISPILRIIKDTSPAMIITNPPSGIWRNVFLTRSDQPYVENGSDTEEFEEQWQLEWNAWIKLSTEFQRKHLVKLRDLHQSGSPTWSGHPSDGLFAYIPYKKGEELKGGFVAGETGVDTNIGEAEWCFINC